VGYVKSRKGIFAFILFILDLEERISTHLCQLMQNRGLPNGGCLRGVMEKGILDHTPSDQSYQVLWAALKVISTTTKS
jgi:hypothetical protein